MIKLENPYLVEHNGIVIDKYPKVWKYEVPFLSEEGVRYYAYTFSGRYDLANTPIWEVFYINKN